MKLDSAYTLNSQPHDIQCLSSRVLLNMGISVIMTEHYRQNTNVHSLCALGCALILPIGPFSSFAGLFHHLVYLLLFAWKLIEIHGDNCILHFLHAPLVLPLVLARDLIITLILSLILDLILLLAMTLAKRG